MTMKKEHELHTRRKGRNIGVGLMLGGFVILIMALTYVKITSGAFELPNIEVSQ
ncbi:MAG: hypothetical protein ACI9PY_002611 [Ascidiaceihabitans sp.]|jgi:hypothetical protein